MYVGFGKVSTNFKPICLFLALLTIAYLIPTLNALSVILIVSNYHRSKLQSQTSLSNSGVQKAILLTDSIELDTKQEDV